MLHRLLTAVYIGTPIGEDNLVILRVKMAAI